MKLGIEGASHACRVRTVVCQQLDLKRSLAEEARGSVSIPFQRSAQLRRCAQHPLATVDENRSSEPQTCRRCSMVHTRSESSARAQSSKATLPAARA
jgi:hypothetical protein